VGLGWICSVGMVRKGWVWCNCRGFGVWCVLGWVGVVVGAGHARIACIGLEGRNEVIGVT